MKFALYFGNRGFMPGELITGARADMIKAVTDAGYEYLVMDESLTRYGAVETRDEGRLYHDFLKEHEGEYDGVILCMPIFIDENGAITALQDAGVPILMQAYPDEIGKMDFKHRRDAYCGKFSLYRYEASCGASSDGRLPSEPRRFCSHLPCGKGNASFQSWMHRCENNGIQNGAL